jgi:hypothetical protein
MRRIGARTLRDTEAWDMDILNVSFRPDKHDYFLWPDMYVHSSPERVTTNLWIALGFVTTCESSRCRQLY